VTWTSRKVMAILNLNLSYDQQAAGDLYDDVLASADTAIKDEKASPGVKKEPESPGAGANTAAAVAASHQRRYQLYVGNLTWWTTDQDIQDVVSELGVHDFLEVKFYENRANGQSKGFCCVSLGSEASMRLVMEKVRAVNFLDIPKTNVLVPKDLAIISCLELA